MPWTTQQKLEYLLGLPWTIEVVAEDDYQVLRVTELPSVIATGQTKDELEADFWESLKATLESYLHYGDPIPLPTEVTQLPWDRQRVLTLLSVKVGLLEARLRPPHIESVAPTETRSRFQALTVPVP